MPTPSIKSIATSLLLSSGAIEVAYAQDSLAVAETSVRKSKIKRVEEPVPYWVHADQLRIRNNPYAGDVIGMLEVGEKVKVRKMLGNWGLISSPNASEQWVNRDFLSQSPVAWRGYNYQHRMTGPLDNNRFRNAKSDVSAAHIHIKELKGVRIYAAKITRISESQKIVISRHDYSAGPYFEKRLVKCNDSTASHVKILGEGYSVMMMEADSRNQRIGVSMSEEDRIENEAAGIMDAAIAAFTCETDSL
jgi:hypothetical protein